MTCQDLFPHLPKFLRMSSAEKLPCTLKCRVNPSGRTTCHPLPTATFRWLAHLRPTAFPLHMRRHDRPLRDSDPYQFLDRCLRPLTAFVTLPRTRRCQWFVCAILPLLLYESECAIPHRHSRGIPMGLAASAFAPTAFPDSHTPLTVARLNSDRPSKDSIASAHLGYAQSTSAPPD